MAFVVGLMIGSYFGLNAREKYEECVVVTSPRIAFCTPQMDGKYVYHEPQGVVYRCQNYDLRRVER